jgi:large subunit ribosomal protein L22
MIAKATIKKVRISPRKARIVVNAVRGKKVDVALAELKFINRKAAGIVSKVIKSAAANAEENKKYRDTDHLYISELRVDEGPAYKRYCPRAYGRASLIKKRTSHITVTLSEVED